MSFLSNRVPASVRKAVAEALHECPYCHKEEAAEVVTETQTDSTVLQPQDLPSSNTGVLAGTRQFNPGGPEVDPKSAVVVTSYLVHYRCKHCGREWSETKTKDVKIPEEYAEYEDEERNEAEPLSEEEEREEE